MAMQLKTCCIGGNCTDHCDVSENKGYNAIALSYDRESAQLIQFLHDEEHNYVYGRISMKAEAWKLNCLKRVYR